MSKRDDQRTIRELNAKRRRLKAVERGVGENAVTGSALSSSEPVRPAEPPKRLTVSEVARTLLDQQPRPLSHVGLSRNAKGDTQIEVVVYPESDARVAEAMAEAQRLYDHLRDVYPMLVPPAVSGPEPSSRGRKA